MSLFWRTSSQTASYLILCLLALVGLAVSSGLRAVSGRTLRSGLNQKTERTYDTEFNPTHQRAVSAETKEIRISLKKNQECKRCPGGNHLVFGVVNKRNWTRSEFVLENEIAQVDELHVVSPSKTAVIGRVMSNVSMVSIVQVKTGKLIDSFYCFRPTVSPNKKLVAYEKIFPLHFMEGVSAEYLVYDFTQTPTENRNAKVPVDNRMDVGLPVFPPGSLNLSGDNITVDEPQRHTIASDSFFWSSDSKKIAFADGSNGKNSVVVVDISAGLKAPAVWTKTLNAEEIVDLARCADYKGHPEYAFYVSEISYPRGNNAPVIIQLSSPNPACLKRHTLELPTP